MAYDELSILKASSAVTDETDGGTTGVQIDTTAERGMTAVCTVTAVSGSGSPKLVLEIQESANNSDWNTCAVFDNITGKGTYHCRFASNKKYLRTNSTVTGTTPSFTYSVNVTL